MFNEERKKELDEQRKGFSLAAVFAKPRPMWAAPPFIGVFGDAFIERTTLEASGNLGWSYMVLNHALQRLQNQSFLCSEESGLDHNARVGVSDTLHVLQRSVPLFQLMLRMMKTPSDSQLLSFLRKLKKYIEAIGIGESLLLPAIIENEEMVILLERTTERLFRAVVIQTNALRGLQNHASSASSSIPFIKYRTCMIFNNIPKKNALDDVFWMSVYNMAINVRTGDMQKFYGILLPFLSGKPLESSLVESEKAAITFSENSSLENKNDGNIFEKCGEWRFPQCSETAYVRGVLEALYYMLRRRSLFIELDLSYCRLILQSSCKTFKTFFCHVLFQVHLALCMELVHMMENDLHCMLPQANGVRVCSLAIRELSHFAVKLVDRLENGYDYHNLIVIYYCNSRLF